ncbi:MAG: DUF4340 domain-containing protein [Candidatus Lernaella stagnicola]|nr:DUF4340 domain-containing protein [Candidatus Lernaella stagnicola]
MNTKKTLILAIVLAALAMFVFLYELPHQREKEQVDTEGDKVVDLDFKAVRKITFERADSKLVFEKAPEGESWRMTEPFQDQTEQWSVQSLISAVQYARPERKITDVDEEAIRRFGLAEPRAVISYETGEVVKRVRIGGKNAVGNTAYVKPESESVVYLVSESSLSVLQKRPDDFRRTALLAPPDAEKKLHRVTLAAADAPPITLVGEKPAGEEDDDLVLPSDLTWHLDSPTGPIADQEVVKGILDRVAALKTGEFIDQPDETTLSGFEKPSLVVRAAYGRGENEIEIVLEVGAKKEKGAAFYARVTDRAAVMAVNQNDLQPFRVTRRGLRDRRLIPALDKEKVAMIDLQSPGASFRVSRSAGGWAFADERPVDAEKIEQLLENVLGWRAESLIDDRRVRKLSRAVRGSGVSHITFLGDEAQILESIRFSDVVVPGEIAPLRRWEKSKMEDVPGLDEKRLIALVSGGFEGAVYLVKPELLDDLPQSIDEIKKPVSEKPPVSGEDATPDAGD